MITGLHLINPRIMPGSASTVTAKNTIVVIGDSWVEQEKFVTTPAQNGPSRGVFHWLNAFLGGPWHFVNIAGTGGQTVAQVAARFSVDVLSYAPGYVGIICGVNSVAIDVPVSSMFSDYKSMIDTAIASGIIPIVLPCPLVASGWGSVSDASIKSRVAIATGINRRLGEYAREKSGWLFASKAYDHVTDQLFNHATYSTYCPQMLAQYRLDGAHPAAPGAYRIAKDIYAELGAFLPKPNIMPRHMVDQGNGWWNPMMLTSGTDLSAGVTGGAGITGTPPEGWYARIQTAGTGAVTVSQVARTDIAGANWYRAVATAMQAGQNLDLRESNGTAFTYTPYKLFSDYGLAAGDTVKFSFEFRLSSISGTSVATGELNQVTFQVQILDGSNSASHLLTANTGTSSDVNLVGSDMDGDILVVSPPAYVLAANDLKWWCYVSATIKATAAGATDFTIDVGRASLRKVN